MLTIFAYKGASFDPPATSWLEAERRAWAQNPELCAAYDAELKERAEKCWDEMRKASFLYRHGFLKGPDGL